MDLEDEICFGVVVEEVVYGNHGEFHDIGGSALHGEVLCFTDGCILFEFVGGVDIGNPSFSTVEGGDEFVCLGGGDDAVKEGFYFGVGGEVVFDIVIGFEDGDA